MKKEANVKAQLSLFMLFGIIILISISFISFLSSNITKPEIKEKTETAIADLPAYTLSSIRSNIEFCLKGTANEAVDYVGLHGGYYNVPEPKINHYSDELPFYVRNGESKIPTIRMIESQISAYVMEQLPDCVQALRYNDAVLNGTISFVNASVGMDSVIVYVNYPITVRISNSAAKISDFRAEVPVRLEAIYQIASNISREQISNNRGICADCLIGLGRKNNVFIDAELFENNVIFSIIDGNITDEIGQYIFSFAVD